MLAVTSPVFMIWTPHGVFTFTLHDLLNFSTPARRCGAAILQRSTFSPESLIYRENLFFPAVAFSSPAIFHRAQALGLWQEGLGGIYTLFVLPCELFVPQPRDSRANESNPGPGVEDERQPNPRSVESKAAGTHRQALFGALSQPRESIISFVSAVL